MYIRRTYLFTILYILTKYQKLPKLPRDYIQFFRGIICKLIKNTKEYIGLH